MIFRPRKGRSSTPLEGYIGESVRTLVLTLWAGNHTDGVQWMLGVGINGLLDGKLVLLVTQSQVPGGIVAQAYEIILPLHR